MNLYVSNNSVNNITVALLYLAYLYWLLLTLHITPVTLLYSSMENTVIQHTFLKLDQSKKKQIFNKNPRTPDKTEKPQI